MAFELVVPLLQDQRDPAELVLVFACLPEVALVVGSGGGL